MIKRLMKRGIPFSLSISWTYRDGGLKMRYTLKDEVSIDTLEETLPKNKLKHGKGFSLDKKHKEILNKFER